MDMAGGDESIYAAGTLESAGELPANDDAHSTLASSGDFALLRGFYWRLKRPLGLILALASTLLAAPVLVSIMLILSRQGRPVFIRRQRLGLHGRPFTVLHFRTMVPDSLRSLGAGQAPATDNFGQFLKRSRLDHLPLLWNVIKGDMNLVGPRPLSQEELMGAGRLARFSLAVRPGLTGLWLVEGERDLRRRLASDRSYIDRAGPLLDLSLVLRTVAHMHGV
ncbi:MAG: hypothetical protein JWQ90_950 [Hydrocarboniphaga sp.]|uniref:sugar transferase n=1 Tax=Hydrocarboniphaga sp. TaxID=2033016 RepID=UPI002622F424|nr:sugar transferase [Hydrocarboniphaga sp.]MDB5968500.1 hypothetical protein [Hydrocarboniphaga sp.]